LKKYDYADEVRNSLKKLKLEPIWIIVLRIITAVYFISQRKN